MEKKKIALNTRCAFWKIAVEQFIFSALKKRFGSEKCLLGKFSWVLQEINRSKYLSKFWNTQFGEAFAKAPVDKS